MRVRLSGVLVGLQGEEEKAEETAEETAEGMGGLVREVEGLWGAEVREGVAEGRWVEVGLLGGRLGGFLRGEVGVEDLLFEAEAVLERCWETLNVGKWAEVAEERKQAYAIASFVKIVALLHENKADCLQKSLQVTDLGILLGLPFKSLSLTKVADLLSSRIRDPPLHPPRRPPPPAAAPPKRPRLDNEVDSVSRPSLQSFRENYFARGRPVKLTECMEHWPALQRWKDFRYIVRKAGHRTVPVELGRHYADGSYSQKLMKVSEFVEEYFREGAESVGYLAQHQLFDQVPELKKDITEPDYCAITQTAEASCQTEINAWFGPKGTVSPLHFDPKHNLLCQVVGTKKIILYPQSDSEYLYPHEGSLLFNTSRVDVEEPDLESFPDFEKARKAECLLTPGDMLYIPPRYWHHVRALEDSFSVSFWWE